MGMVLHNWLCAFMHISFNPHRSPFYKWGCGSNSFGNLLNIMQLLCSRVWNLNHKFFVTKFYFPLLSAASLMIWPCIHSIKQIKDIPGITQHLLQETSFGELLIGEVLTATSSITKLHSILYPSDWTRVVICPWIVNSWPGIKDMAWREKMNRAN